MCNMCWIPGSQILLFFPQDCYHTDDFRQPCGVGHAHREAEFAKSGRAVGTGLDGSGQDGQDGFRFPVSGKDAMKE